VILSHLMELIFGILGTLASGFVVVLLKKFKFEAYTDRVETLLAFAVGFAEQKSSQALKLNGQPLDGAAKLATALDFIEGKAKEYGVADKGKDWWTGKVEGWLGVSKM